MEDIHVHKLCGRRGPRFSLTALVILHRFTDLPEHHPPLRVCPGPSFRATLGPEMTSKNEKASDGGTVHTHSGVALSTWHADQPENPRKQVLFITGHLMHGETEAHSSEVTCLRSHTDNTRGAQLSICVLTTSLTSPRRLAGRQGENTQLCPHLGLYIAGLHAIHKSAKRKTWANVFIILGGEDLSRQITRPGTLQENTNVAVNFKIFNVTTHQK